MFDKSVKRRLEAQMEYTITKSRFYQNKFKQFLPAGNYHELFEHLPFTTKQELLADQELFPPFGSNMCVRIDKCKRVHKTSGTTNKPLLILLTDHDIQITVDTGKKCFYSSGLRKNDIVVHCLSYNMWMGGYTDHQSLEAAGAAVIPFGVGNTRSLIETVLLIKPNVIHCTPSYLSKIEIILKNEYALKPMDLGLKLGLFGAESGLQHEKFRMYIEEKWGLKAMNANYGLAEVLSMFGAECYRQEGLHFMAGKVLYPELISPDKLEHIPIETGNTGELVLTNLDKRAQPLFRYRTNDIIKILSTEPCECGNKGFKFEVIGRSDDMFVVKGINVFVNAIENIISGYLDVLSGNFQIHINASPPVTRIQLHIELSDENKDKKQITERLIQTFKSRLFISPEIIVLPFGTLPRAKGKSKKLFKTLI